jgi:L-amino acid N-acyltransferase YncA
MKVVDSKPIYRWNLYFNADYSGTMTTFDKNPPKAREIEAWFGSKKRWGLLWYLEEVESFDKVWNVVSKASQKVFTRLEIELIDA